MTEEIICKEVVALFLSISRIWVFKMVPIESDFAVDWNAGFFSWFSVFEDKCAYE